MNALIRKPFLVVILLAISLGSVTVANVAGLQEKLKRQVRLELNDVTIAAALQQIGDKGGFVIELSDEAIWELPDGAETRLSATLEGQLDQSLEEMLNAFFMRYAVGSDAVVVYPRPELKHIMGRPTAQTLRLLRNIYTNGVHLSGTAATVQLMSRSAVSQMAGEEVSVFPLDMAQVVAKVMTQMVRVNQNGTTLCLAPILDEVVESVSRDHDRWVVCAPEWPNKTAQIKIISRSEYSRIMGEHLIDISFDEVTGGTILKSLAAIADIDLTLADDDGAWLDRPISIEALNVTVDEALKRVVAALGGEFKSIHDGVDGIHYSVGRKLPVPTAMPKTSPSTPSHSQSVPAGDAYVGKISIPMDGGKYFLEFMLRESDLTDELRRLRAARIQEILKTADTSETPEAALAP